MPLVLAVVLKLLLQPALRLLERWRVPRMIAALLLILAVFGTIVGLGAAIAGPASTWAAKLPEGIPRLQERLSFVQAPINTLQRFLQQVENYGQREQHHPTALGGRLNAYDEALHRHPELCQRILYDDSVSVFPLVSGDIFLRRLVEILPASATSGRPSTSRNRSKTISLRIWSRLRS